MALTAGTTLGPYEIVGPIGAGGMGEVYRARDTRLARDVAIKILPESFARDAERMRRFEQEARAVAALNHPNIVVVYDTGAQDGSPYLVSELLEGQTLRDRLNGGPISQKKAIEYGLQVADGLASAHEKGIVHRDLKPENLFLTSGGRVKILDFGLAKVQAPKIPAAQTMTSNGAATAAGMVMGTASYMSPEQVRGDQVDHRSDIFSFGAVLYEMLTGSRAFQGGSSVETMNAILKEEPAAIDSTQMKVSPGLERIVTHCLEKNPADRFQSARDLGFALGALSGTGSAAALPARKGALPNQWLAAAVAVVVIVAIAAAYLLRKPMAPAERMEFAIPMKGEVSHLAISPDGHWLAFVSPDDTSGENMLNVQRVGSPTATVLPGTEGATYPFWSPDDAYVGFFADGKLKKVATANGVPQTLTTASNARGGAWGRNGTILFTPDASGPLWSIHADGSHPAALTEKWFDSSEPSQRWPAFLPDGDHFLVYSGNFSNDADNRSGIYMSSLSKKDKRLVLLARSLAGYSQGSLFYVADRQTLTSVPIDVTSAKLTGAPHVVQEGVGFQPSTYWGAFSVSENGTIVYNTGAGGSLSRLTWFDRSGKQQGTMGESGVLANPILSPDGTRVTVDVADIKANNVDIWVANVGRGTSTRFTFDPAEEVSGVWSRDGSMIVYRSAAGKTNLYLKKASGLEAAKPLVKNSFVDADAIPNSWSADDKQLMITLQPGSGGSHLAVVSIADGNVVGFNAGKGNQTNGQISPDGKWVAYSSNESGDWEIYVTTFPGAEGKWQVSRGGGKEPKWRGDGKELFYVGSHGMVTAVPVDTDGGFSSGTPAPLFQFHGRAQISSTDLYTYDVTRDGKRFLVNRYIKPDQIPPLTIVLNATSDLQK